MPVTGALSRDSTLSIYRKVRGQNFPSGGYFHGIIFAFTMYGISKRRCSVGALERRSVAAGGGRSGNGQKDFETERIRDEQVITTKDAKGRKGEGGWQKHGGKKMRSHDRPS